MGSLARLTHYYSVTLITFRLMEFVFPPPNFSKPIGGAPIHLSHRLRVISSSDSDISTFLSFDIHNHTLVERNVLRACRYPFHATVWPSESHLLSWSRLGGTAGFVEVDIYIDRVRVLHVIHVLQFLTTHLEGFENIDPEIDQI